MRVVRTGRTRHEWVEIPDVKACSTCGEPFQVPRFTTSWRQCVCTDGQRGHREFHCLRPGCRGVTDDPPCRGQWGPTASYGS